MSISKRILQFADYKNLRISEIAKESNTRDSTLRNIIRRDGSPSADILANLVSTYDDLNINWLLTGEGNMLLGSNENLIKEDSIKDLEKMKQTIEDLEDRLKLAQDLIDTQKILIEHLKQKK